MADGLIPSFCLKFTNFFAGEVQNVGFHLTARQDFMISGVLLSGFCNSKLVFSEMAQVRHGFFSLALKRPINNTGFLL